MNHKMQFTADNTLKSRIYKAEKNALRSFLAITQ